MFALLFLGPARAQDLPESAVMIDGDTVEYSMDGSRVIAKGNVVVYNKAREATLYCDEVQFSRATNLAEASGNVRLVVPQGELSGNKISFNFETMEGDMNGARIESTPLYGWGRYGSKVGEKELLIRDGFITTSDWDKPEYRIESKKWEVHLQDKFVARHIRIKWGNIPIMYLPRYTHDLVDPSPKFLIIPGSSKDWGEFLLSWYRYKINDSIKGRIYLDYRSKRGLGLGFDTRYFTKGYGDGIVKTYYTQERLTSADHFWEERELPTVERQRYKIEMRHKWKIDKTSNMVMQYYKLSDSAFLKDFFEDEYRKDPTPDTYFLLTKGFSHGTLSLRTDVRINRFDEAVERIPELRYDMPSTEIGETGLYFKNVSTFSKLIRKTPAPSEVRPETTRFDTDNEFSYPLKAGIIEFKPFVGAQNTYYSRTAVPGRNDIFRTQFKTGVSASTKFYRVFDVEMDKWGFEINRLRHIITPTVSYQFKDDPTVLNAQLDAFDSIDAPVKQNSIVFGLENKLQTKRAGQSFDLLRTLVEVDYPFKDDALDSGFNKLSSSIDFLPISWLSLYFDSSYDIRKDHLDTANVDLYFRPDGANWNLSFGKRFAREVGDQLETQFYYKLNPKWAFKILNRFDIDTGEGKEIDVVLTRDLHTWEMDFNFNETRGDGSEFLVVFRLKAFPEIGFDTGTSFNQRKPGAQNSP